MGFPSHGGASCALAGVENAIAGNESASAATSDSRALEYLLSGDCKENTSSGRVGQPPFVNRGGGRGAPGRLEAVCTLDALGTCAVRRATHTIEASLADVRTHVVGHLMCGCRRATSRRKH